MAQGESRSASQAGLSPDHRPVRRRRVSDGSISQSVELGVRSPGLSPEEPEAQPQQPESEHGDLADPLACADAAQPKRPFEVAGVHGSDVFALLNSSNGAGSTLLACSTADEVEAVHCSLKQQMDTAHYQGDCLLGLAAAMFAVTVSSERPQAQDLVAALRERAADSVVADASQVLAGLRSVLGTLRCKLHSMGASLQHLQRDLPLLLDQWGHTASKAFVCLLAALTAASGRADVMDVGCVLGKPFDELPDNVKLQTILTGRLQQQGAKLVSSGTNKLLVTQRSVKLAGEVTMWTHVWQPLYKAVTTEQRGTGSTDHNSGEPLDVRVWCTQNHTQGDALEDSLFSRKAVLSDCEQYISNLPLLQLSPPQVGLFCFACPGGEGAIVNMLTEQVRA